MKPVNCSFVVPLAATLEVSGLRLDVDIANAHVRRWLDEVANARVHATTKEVPAVRLQEERAVTGPIYPGVPDRGGLGRGTTGASGATLGGRTALGG